jgi:methylenetetrahydrofolate reductase (NADPH)
LRFPEIYAAAREPVLSFEVFPPRDEAAGARLDASLPLLRDLEPGFMTCTYGAGGSTRDKTLEIASRLRNELKLEAACHLTCVGSGRDELRSIVHRIREAGIDNIVALRGDPPAGETAFRPVADGLAHASELVDLIRSDLEDAGPELGIAVAGYPETHTEAESPAADLAHLKRKVEAGADLVITQLFFDNADFYAFRRRAVQAGIRVPIVPGLMPVRSAAQIQRIAGMCGARIPAALSARLAERDGDAAAVRALGAEICLEQARDLLEHDVPGIHFYVLNSADAMAHVLRGLGRA